MADNGNNDIGDLKGEKRYGDMLGYAVGLIIGFVLMFVFNSFILLLVGLMIGAIGELVIKRIMRNRVKKD